MIGRLLAAAAVVVTAVAGDARAAPPGSPWGAGYFPDVSLTTQDGKTVRFYSDLVKDKFVVVNFLYTHCKKACPLETANLVRVQRRLGDRVGRDIFLYSITLDPQRDTPEVLKAYAQAFHAGPGWLFLTGKREDIALIRARLGDRTTLEDHAIGLSLGNDPQGQWTTLSAVDDPGFLAANIDGWMRTTTPARPGKSYAEAPPIRLVPGEELFRTRCAACHTIGAGASLGPDLAGVTERRDRRWLTRWLLDPEQMLAAKDPLALELLANNRQLAMPSTGLTEQQVAELISYLASRSPGEPPRDGRRSASR